MAQQAQQLVPGGVNLLFKKNDERIPGREYCWENKSDGQKEFCVKTSMLWEREKEKFSFVVNGHLVLIKLLTEEVCFKIMILNTSNLRNPKMPFLEWKGP